MTATKLRTFTLDQDGVSFWTGTSTSKASAAQVLDIGARSIMLPPSEWAQWKGVAPGPPAADRRVVAHHRRLSLHHELS